MKKRIFALTVLAMVLSHIGSAQSNRQFEADATMPREGHQNLTHHASPAFWRLHRSLLVNVRRLADGAFALLKADSRHPSLYLKKVGGYWSVSVGLHH